MADGPSRSASCSSRTTTSSGRRSSSCSSSRTGSRSSARSPTAPPPSSACREHRPDVVRDGLPAARAWTASRRRSRSCARLPGDRRRLPDRLGEPARARRAARGGRGRLPAQGPGARRDRRRDPRARARPGRPVNLTARTRRSCSTRPPTSRTRQIRFPNCASCRSTSASARRASATTSSSTRTTSTRGCSTAPELPTTSQPTPQDFLAVYEALAGYERIYSLHISAKLSGHVPERVARGGASEGDRIRARRHRVRLGRRSRCSRSAIQDCSSAARPTRRSRRWSRATASARGSSSPSTRSSSSPRAAASAAARRWRASC